jgi:hypothetical protein
LRTVAALFAAAARLGCVTSLWTRVTAAAVAAILLAPASGAAGYKRPRPASVAAAATSVAPNDFQLYNDYASPERTYPSQRTVVHYVVTGIDAPPLNDDDADGVPDYVTRVGVAADRALAYYERRGFPAPRADEGGPDARPDIYISRFSPGTLGVSFPAARAEGGAFVVVANNLDPSSERSFASVYATVAHELFHLTQFAYYDPGSDPPIPTWILEGTAAAMESRVCPDLDDLVSAIQLRRWFSATAASITTQSYGAQLLWRQLDLEEPRFLPTLFAHLAAHPVQGDGERLVSATYARVAHRPFADAFRRYAVSIAADYADRLSPTDERTGVLEPLSVRYLRVTAPHTTMTVSFPDGRGGAASTLVYRLEGEPGHPARTRAVTPRESDDGRELSFTIATGPSTTALLVLSNGGQRAVAYTVDARRRATR